MGTGKQIIKAAYFAITLLFVLLISRQSHQAYISGEDETIHGRGNAPK